MKFPIHTNIHTFFAWISMNGVIFNDLEMTGVVNNTLAILKIVLAIPANTNTILQY